MRLLPRRLLCLAGGLLAAAALAAPQAVQVPSLDRHDGGAITLPGFWYPAATASRSPAPAMLLLHGCGGVYGQGPKPAARYRELAERLNTMGVHVLVTDSLTPRGEKELCTQRTGARQVTMLNRRRDALGALQWLAARPEVDRRRLGLLGWSNGGSTVLAASNRRHSEVARAPVTAALAVAFYPGCETELRRGYEATAPLLLLVGEADDWTPAAPCQALARRAVGASTQIEVYAGAYHGFDGSAPVRLRTDVPNGANPGRGVHVGADAAARTASALRLTQFLREQWALP